MEKTILTVQDISKTFGKTKAVIGLSFSVEAGSCFGFLGPNGAGKTTVMKMIYGKCLRDRDANDRVRVFGYDPADNELAIKHLSGVVQQEDNLDDELNVVQNLRVYSRFYNMPGTEAKERIEYLLRFLELTEKAGSKMRELSGGMKRRLVIARALLNNPRLLILDEPTTGLDPQVRHLIWDKIHQLQRQGTTVLLTTHYMEEAFQLCDRLLIMHKGGKIMEGPPKEMLQRNIEEHVLEVMDCDATGDIDRHAGQGVRIDRGADTRRYYSNDFERLRELADRHLKDIDHLIRHTNLEDLFLKATGRHLSDRQ